MEWTADVSAGEWLRERLDADWSTPSRPWIEAHAIPEGSDLSWNGDEVNR